MGGRAHFLLAVSLTLGCSGAIDLGRATPLQPVRAPDRGAVSIALIAVDLDMSESIGGTATSPGGHYFERYYRGDASLPAADVLSNAIASEFSRAGHAVSEGASHQVEPHLVRVVVNRFGQSTTWAQALVVIGWDTSGGERRLITTVAESSRGMAVALEDAVRFAGRRFIQDAWAAGELPLQASAATPSVSAPAAMGEPTPAPVTATGLSHEAEPSPTLPSPQATAPVRRGPRLSDAQIRKRLIVESRESYDGNCPCPYDTDAIGRRCGGRSAWSREGGYAPLCYARDVSDDAVRDYRAASEAAADEP